MRNIILALSLLLAGCGSYLADKHAQEACQGFPQGSDAYANCYASSYQTERANQATIGAAAILSKPFQTAPATHTTTCYQSGNSVTCY